MSLNNKYAIYSEIKIRIVLVSNTPPLINWTALIEKNIIIKYTKFLSILFIALKYKYVRKNINIGIKINVK